MKPRSVFLLFLFLAAAGVTAASATDWPTFLSNERHNGLSEDSAPEADSVLWSFRIPNLASKLNDPIGNHLIWSSPTVADGQLYVTTRRGLLYCFDADSCAILWSKYVGSTVTSTPAVDDTAVYILGGPEDRRVRGYSTTDGTEVFTSPALGDSSSWAEGYTYWVNPSNRNAWVESSPVLDDGEIFVGSRDGYLYCLDIPTQAITWQTAIATYVTSTPAVTSTRVFCGGTADDLYPNRFLALDRADGDTLYYWEGEMGNSGGVMSSPNVIGNGVYIGANWVDEAPYGGSICYFSIPPGDNQQPVQLDAPAKYEVHCDVRGVPIRCGDLVYASTGKGLYCLNASGLTPAIPGLSPTAGIKPGGMEETWSSFAISVTETDTLLFIGEGGSGSNPSGSKLWCLSTELDTLWYHDIGSYSWSTPAIADNKVYMTSAHGKVYCFANPDEGDGGGRAARKVHRAPDLKLECPTAELHFPPVGLLTRAIELSYVLPNAGPVRLEVLDASGRRIRGLLNATQDAGTHTLTWDGRSRQGRMLSAGIYYYRLSHAGESRIGRLTLIR